MQSGAIVVPTEGDSKALDGSSYPQRRREDGEELLSTVNHLWTQSRINKAELEKAEVAKEDTVDIKKTRITEDGGVREDAAGVDIVTQRTEVFRVPEEFALLDSTQEDWSFPFLEQATGEIYKPGTIDLAEFGSQFPNAELWMGWFRDNSGALDAGAGYGDISKAPSLAKFLDNNENSQLGLENVEFEGKTLKLVISQSGWIAVYQPQDVGEIEFAKFVREKVFPYTHPRLNS